MKYIKFNNFTKEKKHWINQILHWYNKNKRDLLWRKPENQNFYGVWISEVMLQQTNVQTVEKYFLAFKKKWPNFNSFLDANLNDILKIWQGLGYYQRAKNIHKTLQILRKKKINTTYNELIKLPGIGDYSAASISAILNDQNHAVVDGNIKRILSRVFDIDSQSNKFNTQIYKKAKELTPNSGNGDYCQALMDIGATICRPREVECNICPLTKFCDFFITKKKILKKKSVSKKKKIGIAFVYQFKNEIYIEKSRETFLHGLMKFETSDFLEYKSNDEYKNKKKLLNEKNYFISKNVNLEFVEHHFTNFQLKLFIKAIRLKKKFYNPNGLWISKKDFFNYPFSNLMIKVFKKI